jgi:hypothetical protein
MAQAARRRTVAEVQRFQTASHGDGRLIRAGHLYRDYVSSAGAASDP